MKPMNAATLVMSEETTPTLSVLAALHAQLIHDLHSPMESNLTREIKSTICQELNKRYFNEQKTLYVASAVDARFKTPLFLTED